MTEQLTLAQLRALNIAAGQSHLTPPELRVDQHPKSRMLVPELRKRGLLEPALVNDDTLMLDLSLKGLEVLDAHWRGRLRPTA